MKLYYSRCDPNQAKYDKLNTRRSLIEVYFYGVYLRIVVSDIRKRAYLLTTDQVNQYFWPLYKKRTAAVYQRVPLGWITLVI